VAELTPQGKPSPVKGEGSFKLIPKLHPSPLVGEGKGEGVVIFMVCTCLPQAGVMKPP